MSYKHNYKRNGKYAIINPCMACGTSAGENYKGHPLTDTGGWNDIAICLCLRCFKATKHFTSPNQFLYYKQKLEDKVDKAWDKFIKERGDG